MGQLGGSSPFDAAARSALHAAERERMDELQVALSKAVDLARALPPGCVRKQYDALMGLYVTQIIDGVVRARAEDWNV